MVGAAACAVMLTPRVTRDSRYKKAGSLNEPIVERCMATTPRAHGKPECQPVARTRTCATGTLCLARGAARVTRPLRAHRDALLHAGFNGTDSRGAPSLSLACDNEHARTGSFASPPCGGFALVSTYAVCRTRMHMTYRAGPHRCTGEGGKLSTAESEQQPTGKSRVCVARRESPAGDFTPAARIHVVETTACRRPRDADRTDGRHRD